MPIDPKRVETLFNRALEMPAAERPAFLAGECGGDVDLRARVDRLLAAHDELGSPHPGPSDATGPFVPDAAAADLRPTEPETGSHLPSGATGTFGEVPRSDGGPGLAAGTVIAGRYVLLEVIGEGGMGSVYLAEQTEPVKRQVALKLIKAGMDSKAVLVRFDAERQALAVMDHPNIARVYDGGTTETGQPFFVMELVRGVPITKYCDEHRLSVDTRLQLFVSVCQAVQHAHQKGIIHRDLKPGNVLVTEVDGGPTPKVIDFGVAKATELKLTDMSFADAGAIVGTPAYMSPEQADPTSMDVDTRADTYALGVMLYELLTGSTPLDARQFKRGAILEMLRMVREVEPPKPSTRVSTADTLQSIAASRDIDPSQLTRVLRGDLDWIVMKALEKDRSRRYETANAFAADVLRHLTHEPVVAAPPSVRYRLSKFLRRHRTGALAAAVVFVTLLAGIVGTSWGLVHAERARRDAVAAQTKAVEEKRRADAVRDFLQKKLLGQADVRSQADAVLKGGGIAASADRNVTVRELLDRAAAELTPERIEENFPAEPLLQAELLDTVGNTYRGVGEPATAVLLLQRAAALRQQSLGPDARQTLATRRDLAIAYWDAGKQAEAVSLFEQVREAQERTLGEDHPDALATLTGLAAAYVRSGKYQEAIRLYEQVRDVQQQTLGPEHADTLATLDGLASAHGYAGNKTEAIGLLERVRDARQKNLGREHPDTLNTLMALGLQYADARRVPEAIRLHEQVRDIQQRKLGPEHPDTLRTLNALAGSYLDGGRLSESVAMLEQLHEAYEKKLGRDHPDTLTVACNLGLLYRRTGKSAEAVRLLEKVHEAQEKKLGRDHPETLSTLINLGEAYWAANQRDRAVALEEDVLKRHEAKYGRAHPITLMMMGNLGKSYRDLGRLDDAMPLLEEAYRKSNDSSAIWYGKTLLTAYIRAGKATEAEKLIEELLASTRKWLKSDQAELAGDLSWLGKCLLDLKQYARAEPILRECLAMREQLAKPAAADTPRAPANVPASPAVRPWQVANARSLLGGALLGQKRYADAEPLLLAGVQGLKADEKAIPPQGTNVSDAMGRLVEFYRATGRADEAGRWQKELAARAKR